MYQMNMTKNKQRRQLDAIQTIPECNGIAHLPMYQHKQPKTFEIKCNGFSFNHGATTKSKYLQCSLLFIWKEL